MTHNTNMTLGITVPNIKSFQYTLIVYNIDCYIDNYINAYIEPILIQY